MIAPSFAGQLPQSVRIWESVLDVENALRQVLKRARIALRRIVNYLKDRLSVDVSNFLVVVLSV